MLQTPFFLRKTLSALGASLLALLAQPALAQSLTADTRIPAAVDAALQRAKIPRDAVSLLVMNVDGRSPPNLAWRTHQAMNPASVMKLVTTYAALDQLGPAYVWRTPVYLGGPVVDGALRGNLCFNQGSHFIFTHGLWQKLADDINFKLLFLCQIFPPIGSKNCQRFLALFDLFLQNF